MKVLEIYRSIKEKIESNARENAGIGVKYVGTPHKYYA